MALIGLGVLTGSCRLRGTAGRWSAVGQRPQVPLPAQRLHVSVPQADSVALRQRLTKDKCNYLFSQVLTNYLSPDRRWRWVWMCVCLCLREVSVLPDMCVCSGRHGNWLLNHFFSSTSRIYEGRSPLNFWIPTSQRIFSRFLFFKCIVITFRNKSLTSIL